MQIVLFEPEIPPNTGNIARLCAATQVNLHLIQPLGFSLADKYLKRAGLDYWEFVTVQVWPTFDAYCASPCCTGRLIATSSRQGEALHTFAFEQDDILVFGPETRGLPETVLDKIPHKVRIPIWGKVRSLNLATAAGIVLYQAFATSGILTEVEASGLSTNG